MFSSTTEFDPEGRQRFHSERQGLHFAIVEAAKAWKALSAKIAIAVAFTKGTMTDGELTAIKRLHVDAEIALMDATDRLIAFEAEHNVN